MDNAERKLVKVACPKVEGNELGYYLTYEDDMKDDEVIYSEPEAKTEETKPAKK